MVYCLIFETVQVGTSSRSVWSILLLFATPKGELASLHSEQEVLADAEQDDVPEHRRPQTPRGCISQVERGAQNLVARHSNSRRIPRDSECLTMVDLVHESIERPLFTHMHTYIHTPLI